MNRHALSLVMVLALSACAGRSARTVSGNVLAPRGRAPAVATGDRPLADGACTATADKSALVNYTFAADSGSVGMLDVTDNGVTGADATITLNGEVVVSPPMLSDREPVAVPVNLLGENVLVCRIEGTSGSGLAFQVTP